MNLNLINFYNCLWSFQILFFVNFFKKSMQYQELYLQFYKYLYIIAMWVKTISGLPNQSHRIKVLRWTIYKSKICTGTELGFQKNVMTTPAKKLKENEYNRSEFLDKKVYKSALLATKSTTHSLIFHEIDSVSWRALRRTSLGGLYTQLSFESIWHRKKGGVQIMHWFACCIWII